MESRKYNLFFYEDKNGKSEIRDYLSSLRDSGSKDARIKLNKIIICFNAIKEKGKLAGEPYIKHLEGEIWELRPLRDRILFAAWDGNGFILLHRFVKKTQKTPRKEIDQAKRNLAEFRSRRLKNGKK